MKCTISSCSIVVMSHYENLLFYSLLKTLIWPMVQLYFSYDIILEFSEAIFGSEKEFELSHLETCEVCTGTGAKIGSKKRICSTCGGRGQVMRTEQTPFGMFSQVSKHSLFLTAGFFFWVASWSSNFCSDINIVNHPLIHMRTKGLVASYMGGSGGALQWNLMPSFQFYIMSQNAVHRGCSVGN